MRRNKFGDIYCHTDTEARTIIDDSENGWDVYVANIDGAEGEFGATAEIVQNVSGNLVCYIEAKTEAAVREIIKKLNIELPG